MIQRQPNTCSVSHGIADEAVILLHLAINLDGSAHVIMAEQHWQRLLKVLSLLPVNTRVLDKHTSFFTTSLRTSVDTAYGRQDALFES